MATLRLSLRMSPNQKALGIQKQGNYKYAAQKTPLPHKSKTTDYPRHQKALTRLIFAAISIGTKLELDISQLGGLVAVICKN